MTALQRHMDPKVREQMLGPMHKRVQSTEQGAATTVWAASARQWEGSGGRYLEDCSISRPFDPAVNDVLTSHAPHAYSPESAHELWDLSNKLAGTSD